MDNLKRLARLENFTADCSCCIKTALAVMHENGNGSVVLLDGNSPVGIITESDVVHALKRRIDLDSPAIDIATTQLISTNENRPIEFAFNILSEHSIRRIILIDTNQNYCGIVLQEDLFDYLEEDVYKVDLRISDIIKSSGNIISVPIEASVHDALDLMQEHDIGSVVVSNDRGEYVGIITEKDILKLTYFAKDMNDNIQKHMSTPVVSVYIDNLVTDVIELMKIKSIRRVLIIDDKQKLVTMLTNRDILKHIKGNYTRILQMKIKHAQELMDILPEPIIEIFDNEEEQIINWLNFKAKEVFGADLVDKSIYEIFNTNDWQGIYNKFDLSTHLDKHTIEFNNATYEVSGTISKNLKNRYIKLIFKDVTSHHIEKNKLQDMVDSEIKKRLENEYLLMQQSKLATMGEMIGHIAHQWRQPLAQLGGIFMNLDAAYAFDELNNKYFDERVKHGNELLKYMSTTIDDFRNFFVPNRKKELFNLNEYIQNAINIIHASFTYHHINLEFNHSGEDITLSGYPSEFAQVILNLLVNAQDILVDNDIVNPKVKIDVSEKEEFVTIVVSDNGGGIDIENLPKIFDIYFTTKKQKQGTGLGLYMAKLIIETKLDGTITAFNDSDGACFVICLKKVEN